MFLRKTRPLYMSLLILGVVFLFGAGYHAKVTIDFYFIKDSLEVDATITDIEIIKTRNSDKHNVYVTFELENGELHSSLLDTYAEGMQVGDTIRIIYDKDNPEEIILWWSSPLLVMVFGGIGLLLIVVALIVRRKNRNVPALL